MKFLTMTLLATLLFINPAFAQYDDNAREAAQKAQQDAWAKAQKDKAANDAAVQRQREAEERRRDAERAAALDKLFDNPDNNSNKKGGVMPR